MKDEGPGLGDALQHVDAEDTGSGLGLIEGMLRQLDADWIWHHDEGTHIEMTIPLAARNVLSMKHEAVQPICSTQLCRDFQRPSINS